MSKKNNKKSIKKFNRNAYKIESLEPRLMMDADANDWIVEAGLTTTTMNSFVDSTIADFSANVDGLSRQPSKSNDYERNPVTFDEAFGFVNSLKASSEYKNIESFIEKCVNACRDDVSAPKKAALELAKQNLNVVVNTAGVTQQEIDDAQQLVDDAQQEYNDAWNDAFVTTDSLLAKLNAEKPKSNCKNCNFAKIVNDEILVNVVGMSTNSPYRSNEDINPDIGEQTRLGVEFKDAYDKTIAYSWSFTIDGKKDNGIDFKLHADMSLGFKQDLSKNDAELGVLELKSKADVDESVADYGVNVSLDAGENVSYAFDKSYNVDLNFELKKTNQLEKDLSLNAPSDMVLSGTSLASATWGSDDNLLRKIKYVQMGDVLNKLNDMCYELSTRAREGDRSLKNDDLNGALDQKTTSLIDFSKMFDPILKIPPQSLQELMTRLKAKAEVVVENGEYVLKIPFALSSSLLSKVSFNNDFLQKLIAGQTSGYFNPSNGFRFDVTEKNSLDYTNDST